MTAVSYPYPAVPAGSVPGARRKLRSHHFLLIAGAALGVLVVVITTIVVLVRPTPAFCHFQCGPNVGPRLLNPNAYVSSDFGYRVPYDGANLQIATRSSSGVDLTVSGADAQQVYLDFSATRGSDVNGAVQQALGGIDTNVIQDMKEVSAIPGAELGEVGATGVAYQGNYVPSGGGQSGPVDVAVMAATQDGVTISAVAVGPQDQSSGSAPFFLDGFAAQEFELSISDLVWPGQG